VAPQLDAKGVATGAATVTERLAERLMPLIGAAGFHALLQRAVSLEAAEHPLLEGMRGEDLPNAQGQALAERALGREPVEVREAAIAVIARFLELLAHFLGEELTVRLATRAWADRPPDASPEGEAG